MNNVDEAGAEGKVREARAAIESFSMTVCPAVIHHRSQFQAAIEKGKGVTEDKRAKKAADEIRAVWAFLDRRAKQLGPSSGRRRGQGHE